MAVAAVLTSYVPVKAVSVYWDTNGASSGTGASPNGTWNAATTGNWTTDSTGGSATTNYAAANGSSPSTADVFFSAGTDGVTSANVTLSGAVIAQSITVEELLNISSATTTPSLTLGSGGVTMNSSAVGAMTWVSSLPTILSTSQAWTNNSGFLFTDAGTITGSAASGTQTLTIAGTGAGGTTLTGIIADGTNGGTLGLNINTAAGVVTTLSAANTFTGGLVLTQGILKTGSGSSTNLALGSGTLTLAGGELQLFRPGQTSGANFGRNTLVTGNAQITSGENSSAAGVNHTLGTLTIGAQTLTIAASTGATSGTSGITFGATTFSGNATFNVVNGASANTTLTLGALTGTGTLTKTGTGELDLNTAADVSYGSDVLTKAGSIVINNNTALGTGTLHLGDSSGSAATTVTFIASGGSRSAANNIVVENGSSGAKTIVSSTTGANAAVTLSGNITLNDNLILTTNASPSGGLTLSGTSITGTGAGFDITSNGSKNVTISGTIGAGINNIIQNNALATLTLSGANNTNFTGTVQINQGTATVGAGSVTNAVLEINAGASVSNGHAGLSLAGIIDGASGGGTFADTSTGTARVVTMTGSGNYSFSGSLGSAAVTTLVVNKIGTGTQTLSGVNMYAASTTSVAAGTLQLSGSTGSLVSTVGLNLSGGRFLYDDTGASGAKSQTLNALTFSANASVLQSTQDTAASATLTFASLSRTAGATGNVIYTDGTVGTTNSIMLTSATAGFQSQGVFVNGADYAFSTATSNSLIRAAQYGSDAGFVNAGSSLTTTSHNQVTSSITGQATVSVNTIKFSGAGAVDLGLANNAILTLSNAGLLRTGGGSTTISGTGTAQIKASSGVEYVFRADTASDTLTLNVPIIAVGTNRVTKDGAGRVVLSGTNTYTGQTSVLAGTLEVAGTGTLGTGAVAVSSGGTLELDGTGDLAISNTAIVTLASGASIEMNGASSAETVGQLVLGSLTINTPATFSSGNNYGGFGNAAGSFFAGSTGTLTVVPEPTSLGLIGLGLSGLLRRRRRERMI